MNWRTLVVGGLLLAAAAGRYGVLHARPVWNPDPVLGRFPVAVGAWRSQGDTVYSGRIEELLGADEYVSRTYRAADGTSIGLYVGYYHTQRQGAAIHSPLNCLPGAGWQPVSMSRVPLADGSTSVVNRVIVQKGDSRQLVYYWYQSKGRIVASEYWSKFYLVADALGSRRGDTALVRVMAPLTSADAAVALSPDPARAFAAKTASALETLLFQ